MKRRAFTLKSQLNAYRNLEKAEHHKRFFKTGKGEYGEGDKFLGLTVPQQRIIARKFRTIPLKELQEVIESEYHEHRLTALIILVDKFKSTKDYKLRKEIIDFYLKNTKNINNWDLVDSSAKILGEYLENRDEELLIKLSHSKGLWEQRISIVATSHYIAKNKYDLTIQIAENLLQHEHDLIHKAVGWMLREVGKRDISIEREFLDKHYKSMPRTMLRYAIEKFPENLRQQYLNGRLITIEK